MPPASPPIPIHPASLSLSLSFSLALISLFPLSLASIAHAQRVTHSPASILLTNKTATSKRVNEMKAGQEKV